MNETTAKALWPGEDAVGQRVRFSAEMPWITVVGVARDTRSAGLGEAVPSEVYLLNEQQPLLNGNAQRGMFVLLRTAGDPLLLAAPVRGAIRELDPELAIAGMRSMESMIAESVARQRFTATLLAAFGLVALSLSAIGIYGIMAYGVRRRTREIGIRMALGASPHDVLRMIVRQGIGLALAGLAIGTVSALLLSRTIRGLMFGISATDPWTYAITALLLGGVALLATWLPARRAVSTDPSVALRAD